jgi:hypothetical protein
VAGNKCQKHNSGGKRPLTPYFIFMEEQRELVKKELSDVTGPSSAFLSYPLVRDTLWQEK